MSEMRFMRGTTGAIMTATACWLGWGCAVDRGVERASKVVGVVRVESPNGRVEVEVWVEGEDGEAVGADGVGKVRYRVRFDGREVVAASGLGVELGEGLVLGERSEVEGVERRRVSERYRQHPGKRSEVLNECNEATVRLSELEGEGSWKWEVVVRAYDDGAAVRYRFVGDGRTESLEIAGERTEVRFPAGSETTVLPLGGFTTSYEGRYERRPVGQLPAEWLIALPVLVEVWDGTWAALTEANLTEYAGMYVSRQTGEGGALMSRLSPLPGQERLAVRATLPHVSPWRVVMVADRPGDLIESDLLLNLNEPSRIEDVSWIRPGKTTFPWWNGFYEKDVGFEVGLNTETAKYYIDFCAEAGFEYHSLDGKGNEAWYGGPIVPYEGADPTTGRDGLDLEEVVRYGKTMGVGIRLWMNWQAARDHMDRAFPRYRDLGVEGVMIDFMDRDDQEMVRLMRKMVETAAANRLTVTFHGVSKPTGLERTWPNLLSSEGVLNLEYDKWDERGVGPEHEMTVVFTRMLAGPMDFHQGSFRAVSEQEFRPRYEAPLVIGSAGRTLASYVVYQNHLPMAADYPSAYRGHAGLSVLAAIPSTWDETRVVEGEPGEYVVIARRSGDVWWIGGMTGREGRELEIAPGFLGEGRYRAELWRDDAGARDGLSRTLRQVVRDDVLRLSVGPVGGVVVRLERVE